MPLSSWLRRGVTGCTREQGQCPAAPAAVRLLWPQKGVKAGYPPKVPAQLGGGVSCRSYSDNASVATTASVARSPPSFMSRWLCELGYWACDVSPEFHQGQRICF